MPAELKVIGFWSPWACKKVTFCRQAGLSRPLLTGLGSQTPLPEPTLRTWGTLLRDASRSVPERGGRFSAALPTPSLPHFLLYPTLAGLAVLDTVLRQVLNGLASSCTAARASKSRESGFWSVSSINYAPAIDRRAPSAAVANSKLCLLRPWKQNCQWRELESKKKYGKS